VLLASASLYFVITVQARTLRTLTANTYTVCASGCDFSSIQAAINAVNSGDTLSLAGETFTEPFTIDKSLNIEGAGVDYTILQVAAALEIANTRVITVVEDVSATIKGVTIRYGKANSGLSFLAGYGGGILNLGELTLDSSTVISNSAEDYGGAIYSDKLLRITNSSIISNTAFDPLASGGGIYYFGEVTISDSYFIGNSASNYGGGLYTNSGSNLKVANSSFERNDAGNGGGISLNGGFNDPTAEVNNSHFKDNQSGTGGAIRSDEANITITNSIFEGNSAVNGGAVFNSTTTKMSIWDSQFYRNKTTTNGGAIYNGGGVGFSTLYVYNSYFAENQASSNAGGIYNREHSSLAISTSSFFSNTAVNLGGGLYNTTEAGAIITDTTFEINHADDGGALYSGIGTNTGLFNSTFSGNIADGYGGALGLANAAHLTATNVTIAGNSAAINGGGVEAHEYATLWLDNSIVAGSLSGDDCYFQTGAQPADPFGSVIDLGYNLIEDGSCINDPTSFDGDPLLGDLQDNGGKTETHALLEGSPAIDAIPPESCVVTQDQRGVSRPQGAGCDIGAFEIAEPLLSLIFTGSGSGSVTSDPPGVSCSSDCTQLLGIGEAYTLTAAADAGSIFTGWGAACSGEGVCVVTMTEPISVSASFNLDSSQPPTTTLEIYLPLLKR